MKRRLEKVTSCPGVFQIKIWNDAMGSWVDPERGARYRAFRAEKGPNGKAQRVSKYFDTLTQAKAYYLKGQYVGRRFEEPNVKLQKSEDGMLFGEVVKAWREVWLPNKGISTQVRYISYLQHFHFFWNMPVEKIGPSDVDRWIAHIKKPDYLAKGHSTRCDYKHEYTVLRGILSFYASRYNRNYRMPFLKDHKSMLKVRDKMKVSKDLTVEELQRFMATLKQVCIEHDCEVIYYLAFMQYATYCRIQEAAALHYEDFDFARGRILINKKVQWPRARGMPARLVDGAKVGGGKEIPMPALAAKVFKEWTAKSGITSGMLFQMNGEILTYRQAEYRYTQALKRMGSPFRATHLLRHASLTEYYDTSKDLLMTARMAGQRDVRSTMKYTKIRDEKVTQMQKQMDQKLSELAI